MFHQIFLGLKLDPSPYIRNRDWLLCNDSLCHAANEIVAGTRKSGSASWNQNLLLRFLSLAVYIDF